MRDGRCDDLMALDASLLREFSRNEAGTFAALLRTEVEGRDFVGTALCVRERLLQVAGPLPHAVDLVLKRLALAPVGARFSAGTVLFLCGLVALPARLVLWARYLALRTGDGDRVVTLATFARDFPDGVPTEEGYGVAWRTAKEGANDPGGAGHRREAASTASSRPREPDAPNGAGLPVSAD